MRPRMAILAGALALTSPSSSIAAPPGQNNVRQAEEAVSRIDIARLFHDRAYADQILAQLDTLRAARVDDAEAVYRVDSLRLVALSALERPDEIRPLIDRLIEQRPRDARFYAGPIFAASTIHDMPRAITVVETASRNVPASGWSDLREIFDRDSMFALFRQLLEDNDRTGRVRLAQALYHIGWPELADSSKGDFLRTILIDDRIEQGDPSGAAGYAAGITSPTHIVPLILRKRYDNVLGPGTDRLAILRHALDERDRVTAAAVAAEPGNMRKVLDRIQFLRGLGRETEAYALVQPFTRDIRQTVASGEEGMWIINEGAYALGKLNRHDEALRLMERLSELPVENDGNLISAYINRTDVFRAAGRHAEMLSWAQRLDRDYSRYASEFGKMWIAAATVCALAGLNRSAEAAPHLERLRGGSETNPAAATQAYICVGDLDSAAALLIHRLESDDPDSALLALQNYSLSGNEGQDAVYLDRLASLRNRADVRAALDRVGRVLTLPLARSYWGTF